MEIQSDINSINRNIAALDFGNSRLKVLFDNKFSAMDYSSDWITFLKSLMSKNMIDLILFSSVNREKSNIFVNQFNQIASIVSSDDLLKKQDLIRYENIIGIGSDRLLGLLGALTLTKPPFITIDCGTAITINVLDINNNCLGGTIFPGIYTQLKSLNENTSEINNIEFKSTRTSIGKTTQDAVNIGVIQACISGISSIIKNIQNEYFKSEMIPIIITGGTGKIIRNNLKIKNKIYFSETLVLEGLLSLIKFFNK